MLTKKVCSRLDLAVEFWSRLRLPRVVVYVHTREERFGGQGFSYSFILEEKQWRKTRG